MSHSSQPQRKRHQMQTWIRHRPKKKMFGDFVANIQNDMRPNLKILIFCMYHMLILLCLLCAFSSRFRGTDVHLECKSWPKTVKLTEVLWYRCVNETDQHVIFFFSGPDPPWLCFCCLSYFIFDISAIMFRVVKKLQHTSVGVYI